MKSPLAIRSLIWAGAALVALACNDGSNSGGNHTSEGTQLYDQRPHQNEGSVGAGNDSVTSPGSNVEDIKAGNTRTDINMQNQSNTHGYDTQAGDNGSGSAGGASATTSGQ